jgi:hypothetical protein
MGGYFSERCGGGPVVEDGWKLDLVHCTRKGMIMPGRSVSGSMTWTLTRTGEVTCSIGYDANLTDPAAAWVRLRYTTTSRHTGHKTESNYRVRLETTRPHYGGMRWWFVCPLSGRRARVLYLPPTGGTTFACRQALGLAYHSQRATADDRAVERSLKARQKLGVTDRNMLDMPYCPKPQRMRWRTHARLVGVIRECHEQQAAYMVRRWGHLLRRGLMAVSPVARCPVRGVRRRACPTAPIGTGCTPRRRWWSGGRWRRCCGGRAPERRACMDRELAHRVGRSATAGLGGNQT